MSFRLPEANTRFALPIIHPKTGETVSAETLLQYGDDYNHERDGGEDICAAVFAWAACVYAQLPQD